jgi:hypothetical protein
VNALAVVVSRSSLYFYSLRMSYYAKHPPDANQVTVNHDFPFSAFNVRQPPLIPLAVANSCLKNGFRELFLNLRSFTIFAR